MQRTNTQTQRDLETDDMTVGGPVMLTSSQRKGGLTLAAILIPIGALLGGALGFVPVQGVEQWLRFAIGAGVGAAAAAVVGYIGGAFKTEMNDETDEVAKDPEFRKDR